MLLAELVRVSREVAGARARLKKIDLLTGLLRQLPDGEVEVAVAYLCGEVPGARLQVGPALLRDARSPSAADEASLGIEQVQRSFEEIAAVQGAGSKAGKTRRLGELLAGATRDEQEFLVRLVLGELRQGALEGIMAEAIARAADVPSRAVRRAVMLAGDPAAVASAARREGAAGLQAFSLELFRPVKPMLAGSAEDVGDALTRLECAALEYKLDGARVQVHRSGDQVRVYSRRLNDVTAAVPELVERCLELPVRELILDGEVLALRPDGKPHPFQVTMRRFGRRLRVEEMRRELPLHAFFFDLLHLDGETLIDRPTADRHAAMSEVLAAALRVPRCVTAEADAAERFLQDALRRGHEGIMAKSLEALYEAGSRGSHWLKLKPVHTLDLVVLAAEWGSGRRRGWLSNLHLGARDGGSGGFVMLGKTFKGMTDKMLEWQTEKLLSLEVSRDEYTVYVRPELVVEIAVNELQQSPHYPGGLALRFARVKRYRPDKKPADADTLETVRELHERGFES